MLVVVRVAAERQRLERAHELPDVLLEREPQLRVNVDGLDDERDGREQRAVVLLVEQRRNRGHECLHAVGHLAHDADRAQRGLLANVRILRAQQLFDLAGQIARHLGGRNVAERAEREADHVRIRVAQVAGEVWNNTEMGLSQKEGAFGDRLKYPPRESDDAMKKTSRMSSDCLQEQKIEGKAAVERTS